MSIADICSVLGVIASIIVSIVGGGYKLLSKIKAENTAFATELKTCLQNMETKSESSLSDLRTHMDSRIDKLHEMVEGKNSSLQQYVNDGISELKEDNKELRIKCNELSNTIHTLEKDMLRFKADIMNDRRQ